MGRRVGGIVKGWIQRPLVAGLLLLAAYGLLVLALDPRGYLGTDTGGKVATLVAMEEGGSLRPDVGYWAAAWDPDGRNHPLWFTSRLGDQWVQVTTLPMLYAGYPLYRLGGYHLALLWPALGAVAAAFAARALAERVRPGSGWSAFWVVGLASPVAVYALDFWEHAPSVGLLGWAAVLALDAVERGGWVARGAGIGALVGLAAAMRTEALVYGAVIVAVACTWLLVRTRRVLLPIALGLPSLVVVLGLVAANVALERAVLGTAFRVGRAVGTAEAATVTGQQPVRGAEAMVTSLALYPTGDPLGWLVGGVLVALLAYVAVMATSGGDRGLIAVAVAGVAIIYVARFAAGPGFVPGLFAAAPVAVLGLAVGWRAGRARLLLVAGLAAMPVVWAFQFTGGAGPQWGGRYLLPSMLFFVVVGVAEGHRLPTVAWRGFVVAAAVVTAFGLGWLVVRSHDVARTFEELHERPESVLVSAVAHLPREGGAVQHERRWLTATNREDLDNAVKVIGAADYDTFALVELAGEREGALEVPGWLAGDRDVVRLFAGTDLWVTRYEASTPGRGRSSP